MTTLQLQEQTKKLLLQVQEQKRLLEQQQQQIENSQLTQQQLQQKIQLQELEQQLLQEEQQEKQQQLEQHLFTQQQLEQRLQNQTLEQLKHQQLLQHLQHQFTQPQYSPAAQLFISQNVFQPHHTERKASPSSLDFLHTGTYLAEFTHSPAQAVEAYNDWKHSQWLVPQAFAAQLDPLQLVPTHLPFYSFALITHSVHSGRIGHIKKPADGGEFSKIEYEFVAGRAESAIHTQLHPDVLVYAPTLELVTTPSYDLMEEIWYWKLSDIKPHNHTPNKRHSLPVMTRANSATALDVKMVNATTVQEAWTYAHRKLIRNERYCASQTLKHEHLCDVAEDVRTETTFSHIAVKLVYLPVYVWTHNYGGETYHTVMNAQNGVIHGRRPYSLGLDSCLSLIAGGDQLYSKNDTVTGVVSGADLAHRDNFPVHASPYRVDLPYLVFPPSDQFLVMVSTGWLRVRNISEAETVELVAQKRTSSHVGRNLLLGPGEEKIVAYRGAWCFCVTSGDPQSVLIAYVCTHSGGDKEDLMGMV
jgi:parvulin-like peptidyl-prolyl isomerase